MVTIVRGYIAFKIYLGYGGNGGNNEWLQGDIWDLRNILVTLVTVVTGGYIGFKIYLDYTGYSCYGGNSELYGIQDISLFHWLQY